MESSMQTRFPRHLLDLMVALHDNTGAQIRIGRKLSDRFETTSGVRQGCVLAPALFSIVIDWILNHMHIKPEIHIGSSQFTDLVYANDTAFFVQSASDAADCLSSFSESSSVLGMHTLWPKDQVAERNLDSGNQPPSISVPNRNSVESMDNFEYLGSLHSSDGYCRPDIKRRIGLRQSCPAFGQYRPINVCHYQQSYAFIKRSSYQSYCMHQRHGLYLPLTQGTWSLST